MDEVLLQSCFLGGGLTLTPRGALDVVVTFVHSHVLEVGAQCNCTVSAGNQVLLCHFAIVFFSIIMIKLCQKHSTTTKEVL